MKAALLSDRGVVKVAGGDARRFLDGLVTSSVGSVTTQRARYAALLTPQGKIIADFIVASPPAPADTEHYLLDVPRALAPRLVQRLTFYKLRAKVLVEDLSDTLAVAAFWDGDASLPATAYADPRLPALGHRASIAADLAPSIVAAISRSEDGADYDAHRIALGIPRGGIDFIYDDAFPHEADMDQLGGVDFDKGCFVGQEVVSRMEHRSTARTRVVPVAFDGPPPEAGATVSAGAQTIGMMGSGSGALGRGLASLRLDRMAQALRTATPISAGGIVLRPFKPAWARFAWPDEAAATE